MLHEAALGSPVKVVYTLSGHSVAGSPSYVTIVAFLSPPGAVRCLLKPTWCCSADSLAAFLVETLAAPADLHNTPDPVLVLGVQVNFAPPLRLGIPKAIFSVPNQPRGLASNLMNAVTSGASRDAVALCTFTVAASNEQVGISCILPLVILDQEYPFILQYSFSEDKIFVLGESCKHTPVFHGRLPRAVLKLLLLFLKE
jgi:hypothetical protein